MKQYLEIGKLVNTHGVKGEMKLELWCDSIDYVKQFKQVYLDNNGEKMLNLLSVRPQKNHAIVKFLEVSTIEDAEKYKNAVIYGNRDDADIDEDANYIQDIIGCDVVDIDSEENYGKVVDVLNHGASDILDIKANNGHKYVPVIKDIVKKIDTENQIITIKYMKGLFDED